MRFANIIYNKNRRVNIGDDMQILSVENLYNYMGINYKEVIRISLSDLWDYDGEEVVLPISFPMISYHEGYTITCFSPKIHPVFLGICILTTELSECDVKYLKKYEPIGCRDYHTYKTMKKYDIQAYVGGCLTLCFPRRWNRQNKEKIYCVDVEKKFKQYIPNDIINDCVFTTHAWNANEFSESPEEKTKLVYEEYINEASMVITSRLHAALPCIAAGIPVILGTDSYDFRFCGIDNIVKIYTKETYDKVDWNPQPIYYEEKKKEILDFDRKRLENVYNENMEIDYKIDHLLTPNRMQNYHIAYYERAIKFINEKWGGNVEAEFEYMLWGITQLANMLYIYIRDNYPKAKLVNVIDRAKRDKFCGVYAVPKEEVIEFNNKFVFVCMGWDSKEMNEFFKDKCDYYECFGLSEYFKDK